MNTLKRAALSGLALSAVLALSACGAAEPEAAPADPSAGAAAESTEAAAAEPAESGGSDAPAAAGSSDSPEWADPVSTEGELLGSHELDSVKVDVYQVATGTASSDSMAVDAESKEPLLKEGDEIVFLNFVVTNTSDADIPLGHSLLNVDVSFSDWPYLGGQPGESSSEAYEEVGLSDNGLALGVEDPFVTQPGQVFNVASSLAYEPGKEVSANFTLTPVDEAGELDHDKAEDGETTFTLK